MGQFFINLFSWVDVHIIYCIIKIGNQILWFFFFQTVPFLTRMTHDWTKTITTKMKMTKNFNKNIEKISMAYNIGVAKIDRTYEI